MYVSNNTVERLEVLETTTAENKIGLLFVIYPSETHACVHSFFERRIL